VVISASVRARGVLVRFLVIVLIEDDPARMVLFSAGKQNIISFRDSSVCVGDVHVFASACFIFSTKSVVADG